MYSGNLFFITTTSYSELYKQSLYLIIILKLIIILYVYAHIRSYKYTSYAIWKHQGQNQRHTSTLESHDSQSQSLYTGKDVKLRYNKTKQTKHESTNAQTSCHRRKTWGNHWQHSGKTFILGDKRKTLYTKQM